VQTLVASGHVQTPFRVTVSSQVAGVVSSIPVAVGDRVKAGDTLLTLNDDTARATVMQAQGVVAQSAARIQQMQKFLLPTAQQTLTQTNVALENVQEIYDRTAKLATGGIVSRASLEDARKNLDVARAQTSAAELTVFSYSKGGSDDVLLETQLAQSNAALKEAQSRLATYVIKATRDGVVISRTIEVGNMAQPGIELMELSPTGDTLIVVQVDEKNLGLMTLGQPALVSADAYSTETFPAQVAFINPAVDLQRAAVEVKLSVPNPPAYLREDMTVSVDIEVASRPKALVVNSADLHELKNGIAWVYKIEAGTARHQPVTVGLVSAGKAEVLSGLAEGDAVVPITATAVKDGGRVRSRVAATIKS
jgi:HlyD family secretion protein